jgi:hypothetical protein
MSCFPLPLLPPSSVAIGLPEQRPAPADLTMLMYSTRPTLPYCLHLSLHLCPPPCSNSECAADGSAVPGPGPHVVHSEGDGSGCVALREGPVAWTSLLLLCVHRCVFLWALLALLVQLSVAHRCEVDRASVSCPLPPPRARLRFWEQCS